MNSVFNTLRAAALVVGVYSGAHAAGTPGQQLWQAALGGFLLAFFATTDRWK